jgi:hypothetical protein
LPVGSGDCEEGGLFCASAPPAPKAKAHMIAPRSRGVISGRRFMAGVVMEKNKGGRSGLAAQHALDTLIDSASSAKDASRNL